MVLQENKTLKTIETAITYGICAYIAIMFTTKGEGVKNILLYGSFVSWLISLKWRQYSNFWKEPITILLLIYVSICFLSVFYSVDPAYSLKAIRKELIKGVVLFPILATNFDSEEKLKRLSLAFTLSAVILVTTGYYSFFIKNVSLFKPSISIVHLWHNQFARYINSLLPFIFVLLLFSNKKIYKLLLSCLLILSVWGLILSTSRGGYSSFLLIVAVWILFLAKVIKVNFKKVIVPTLLIIIIINIISFASFHNISQRLTTSESFKQRIEVWIPAIEIIKERPLFGWGYGPKIIRSEKPYIDTPYKAPDIGVHNTFLMITFTTGIIGLISYLSLNIYALLYCWRNATEETISFGSYMSVAVFSIIIGNYFIHSLLELVSFTGLAILLGIAIASKNIKS